MDILFISHVRILRDALVTTLQTVGGNKVLGAFCHDTVDAAASACTPQVLIIDASHPKAPAL